MKKILIVEDELVLLDLLQKKLIKEGYAVSVAQDGEEGLRRMREVKPDLVLLDIMMPRKNGFEVLEEKNQDKKIADIPVVIISNSGQSVEIERAIKLGVKDYLIKADFDPREVIAKVTKIFDQQP